MQIFNSQMFHDNAFIMQFIPMVLVLLMATYPHAFSQVSHSPMGKLFAVSLVLYYTRMNYKYGVLMAIVFLAYYQMTESQEAFTDKDDKDKVKDDKDKVKDDKDKVKDDKDKAKEVQDDGTNLPDIEESFAQMSKPSVITIDQFNDAKDQFIKEKCKNGVLMYKMMPVRNEMADHVYSEIKFTSDEKCNPCSSTCDYNIVEAKMKVEEALVPKISR